MITTIYQKKSSPLVLIPKYEKYVEYMLEIILMQLPRTEKYSIGNEYKNSMYETLKYILYVEKVENAKKIHYLNIIDANINIQRILLRIMKKNHWIDEKKFDYIMNILIKEIGKILGGLIKHYAQNN